MPFGMECIWHVRSALRNHHPTCKQVKQELRGLPLSSRRTRKLATPNLSGSNDMTNVPSACSRTWLPCSNSCASKPTALGSVTSPKRPGQLLIQRFSFVALRLGTAPLGTLHCRGTKVNVTVCLSSSGPAVMLVATAALLMFEDPGIENPSKPVEECSLHVGTKVDCLPRVCGASRTWMIQDGSSNIGC